jgi:dolichol kinase
MNNIDYNWDDSTTEDFQNITDIDMSEVEEIVEDGDLKTRHDLQFARRLFHMGNGTIFATAYLTTLAYQQMVHILGTAASVLYLMEQVRTKYPETAKRLLPVTRFLMRAEEQLKESAMMPYAMGMLLTIITFPKFIALIGVYTLAIADPMSAIIGIKYGKNRIVPHKTLEGSAAFFICTLLISLAMLSISDGGLTGFVFLAAFIISLIVSAFEMIPLKIDDNLTIPLFTSVIAWIVCTILGIQVV